MHAEGTEGACTLQSFKGVPTDVEIDPHLAALRDLYGLLIAAKREPGEWMLSHVPDGSAVAARMAAQREGFDVRIAPHNTDLTRRSISVRYKGDGRGAKR